MIYVFFGKDTSVVREKALAHIQTLVAPGAEVVKITAENYREGMLADMAESASLFGGEQVILLDTPSSDALFKDGVEASLELLQNSEHHFIVIEAALLAPAKKLYAKYAEHVDESEALATEKFNTFALADAFSARDKKMLWTLLMQARAARESNEAVAGILFWQIKMLRLAERTQSPEEAGQKPFVYNKAKRALAKFKKGELDALSRGLLELYHAGHGGKVDMGLALEQWVLEM